MVKFFRVKQKVLTTRNNIKNTHRKINVSKLSEKLKKWLDLLIRTIICSFLVSHLSKKILIILNTILIAQFWFDMQFLLTFLRHERKNIAENRKCNQTTKWNRGLSHLYLHKVGWTHLKTFTVTIINSIWLASRECERGMNSDIYLLAALTWKMQYAVSSTIFVHSFYNGICRVQIIWLKFGWKFIFHHCNHFAAVSRRFS